MGDCNLPLWPKPLFLLSCLQLIVFFVLHSMSFRGKPYGIMSVLNTAWFIAVSMTVQTGTEVWTGKYAQETAKSAYIYKEGNSNYFVRELQSSLAAEVSRIKLHGCSPANPTATWQEEKIYLLKITAATKKETKLQHARLFLCSGKSKVTFIPFFSPCLPYSTLLEFSEAISKGNGTNALFWLSVEDKRE